MCSLLTIIFILFSFFLSGCVGTVQEAASPDTLKQDVPAATFVFPGLVTARAISHSKVELEFYATSGGSDIAYKLYVNSAINPISIDTQSLSTGEGGKYLYTVSDLQANREYKFKITAQNIRTLAVSTKENEAFARTFDNVVTDFGGVIKVSLMPGNTNGSILVDWIVPKMVGGPFIAGPYDPVNYEVTIISDVGGAANINNPLYFGTDKRVVLVPTPPARATPLSNPSSVVVSGLSSGTRYYVQVRAINSLYKNYQDDGVTNIPVSRESNTKFISIKTDASGSLFDFQQDNVVLANTTGSDAFDKIDVVWPAGSGSFNGYRVFYRKYDGIGDANTDDKLTEAVLSVLNTTATTLGPSINTSRISLLENGSFYQVKVALCKDISCSVLSSNPNAAIISNVKAIKVQPNLAPFSGVNSIQPPGQFSESDVVKLKFDAPLATSGFANEMEFYCVNPANPTEMVKFNGNNPIAGSTIPRCNGLFLDGVVPPIKTYTSQNVKGLVTDGTQEYCFAATPAIIGYGDDIRLAPSQRIIRCSFPEVFPPTVEQFPGLKGACAVSAVNGSVAWNLPTGGIYSGFKVFWKEKSATSKFSFPQAVSGTAGYFSSPDLPASTVNYTATDLMPGRTYQIGVVSIVDLNAPARDLYSEYNLRILDCVVPLPIATFKGFTRIFGIGPKIDGRIPNDPTTKAPPENLALYEAIDAEGLPYEIALDASTSPNPTVNYQAPPGRDFGTSLGGAFDGMPEASFGYASSNKGIISLAWEDVDMSFAEGNTIFRNGQPAAPAARTNRTYGYRVYRSTDNKLTWRELTTTNGPVYSMPYSYRPRPNASVVNTRMAFFTDYSVKALSETHDAATGKDIERARNYYYKIVPIFDGQIITYTTQNQNIVRVTLPPKNMAIVHRWMSNRAHCLELDKQFDIVENYTCDYNGVNSKANDFPYRVGRTVLDQAGDILVDRNELGCRYTRGDRVDDPASGASHFKLPVGTKRDPNDQNTYPLFAGFRTTGTVVDPATPFRGCTGTDSENTDGNYAVGFVANYQRYLQGDCMGSHAETIATGACSALQYDLSEYEKLTFTSPGVNRWLTTPEDCSSTSETNPTHLVNKLMGFYAPNFIMQSEFMAVFHNTLSSGLSSRNVSVPIEGPTTGSLSGSRILNNNSLNSESGSQCSINLASVNGSGHMKPRWVSITELGPRAIRFNGDTASLLGRTVDEISAVRAATVEPLTFYNGNDGDATAAAFKLPSAGLRTSSRYRGTTKIAKIMTSNSSKLPPLGRLNPEVATSICNTYFIQTGIASENGTFSPDSAPVAKRPLRRTEFISASAWPETYDTTKIQSLEATASTGSCNSSNKVLSGNPLSKGALISNRSVVAGYTNTPLLTGSSGYNGVKENVETNHTAMCMSRYGIQDMVGNVSESSSEKIFCNYSEDAIFLGPVASTWAGGNGAINQSTGGPDLAVFNSFSERDRLAIIKSGTLSNGSPVAFEFRFRDGSPARSDIKPWVKISVDSGYCSVVDANPVKRAGAVDFFKNVATGYWSPLYSPGGALNTTIVETPQPDQDSVLTWRNGDGRFLDFGPRGMGAAMKSANSISLLGTNARSKYFNPLIGLPLICEAGSCNDSLLATPNDNTSTTISTLASNITTADDNPVISNFPVGNSQITNTGISDFTYSASGFNSQTIPMNNNGARFEYVDFITVDDPVTMLNPIKNFISFPSGFQYGSTLETYRVIWDVPRNSIFSINSGGKSNISTTGRYSASIREVSADGIMLGVQTSDMTSGTRCGILINQEN